MGARYGCCNQPRPRPGDTYWVQAGWQISRDSLLYPFGTIRAMTKVKVLPSAAECRYDNSTDDPRCGGCKWQKNPTC